MKRLTGKIPPNMEAIRKGKNNENANAKLGPGNEFASIET